MLFRIVVRDMSARIFHVAKLEACARGESLEYIDNIGVNQILKLDVEEEEQVANVLSTLETERKLEVVEVELLRQSKVSPTRIVPKQKEQGFTPFPLELIA